VVADTDTCTAIIKRRALHPGQSRPGPTGPHVRRDSGHVEERMSEMTSLMRPMPDACISERTETMGKTTAVLLARLILGGVFAMAASFKFLGMGTTAGYIAAAGFPLALLLAWIAALFESALAIALWTGAFFSEAALIAVAYVLFLAFAFHGPSH